MDAGDAIQGAPLGKLSTGEAVVNIMNAVGYDFCIPGNHEFDYGMARFLELVPQQQAGYYSANFMDLRTKKQALPGYKLMEFEDKKVAFVGATTPEALTTSTPTFFQDAQGKYIYSFCEDTSGKKLYKQLQKNINAARKQGADYVFIVGHLGMDGTTPQWSSENIAKHTTGVDGIIDGHSHERYERVVQNKKGKDVLLAQTGTKLKTVGQLVITPAGKLETKLITAANGKDAEVQKVIAREMDIYAPLLAQPVGEALVQVHSNDPKTCTSASLPFAAVISDILEAFPFGNMCTVLEASGQQVLDALEMGAMSYPEESGGFMQVAGLSYTIDSSVPSSVMLDEKGNFVKVAGARRVVDVMVDGKPLDVNKIYSVGGNGYILKSAGDGMTMFRGAKLLQDAQISDADAIMEYIQNHLNAKISDKYANAYGDGRITIK